MNSPSLSILMPAYNAGAYIGRSIESLLAQTWTDYELIIVNDGSTDDTVRLATSYADPRIRIVDRQVNRGVVYTRNEALELARGRFIAFFDADDIAAPEKFREQIGWLERNPGYGLVASSVRLIDEADNKIGRWKSDARTARIRAGMLFRNCFVNSAVVVRSECLEGLRFTEGMDSCEDYLMWWDVVRSTEARILPQILTYYRIHTASLTGSQPSLLGTCDRKVYLRILEDSGIEAGPEQLDIHTGLKADRAISTFAGLRAYRDWLLHLRPATPALPAGSMAHRRMLVNRWLKTCYLCRKKPLLMLSALFNVLMYMRLLKPVRG